MERRPLIIVKVGGSVITFKRQPMKADVEAIRRLAKVFSKLDSGLVLVHGGGSFGHYEASSYGLSTEPRRVSAIGVAKTKCAMFALNTIFIRELVSAGLKPYTIPPEGFMSTEGVDKRMVNIFRTLLDMGLSPVSFGDVLTHREGFFIVSGDTIVEKLAPHLKPNYVVFLTEEDGVYSSYGERKSLLRELTASMHSRIVFKRVAKDVTGGMERKVESAFEIAKMGTNVFFINGRIPSRLLKALNGKRFRGTIVRGQADE